MDAELWATIRRLFGVEKLSRNAIARQLGIHRATVAKALQLGSGFIQEKRGRKPRSSKLDPYKAYLENRLKQYPKLSGTKLLTELRTLGYTGGHSILREYLSQIRPAIRETFFRIETLPGEFAQVDWANCGTIRIGNALRKLSCFVMVLSYSRMLYLEFTLSQCFEDFIACHINAFKFFQGVTKKCLYDNLKAVCLYRSGSDVRFNPKFMEFVGLYGFEPVLCNVGRGNEKGKVESQIKYIRLNFLAGREITSWPGLQIEACDWRDNVANIRIHGTTREKPILRWELEKPHLLPLPDAVFDASIIRPVKATSQALVRFDGNAYSVPHQWAYKNLTLKATTYQIKIWDTAKLLATHDRSYERGVVVENPQHYEGLLAIKKEALAAKTKDAFLILGKEAEQYLQGLIETELNIPHHIAKIMEYVHLYGKTEVLGALEHALRFKAFGAPYIHNIILQKRASRGLTKPQPIVIARKPEWTKLAVEEPDLSLYDDLFAKEPSNI